MDPRQQQPPPDPIRPTQQTILNHWNAFFSDPLLSLPHLKSHGLDGKIPQKGLRSLYWRYYFSLLPTPTAPTSSTTTTYSLHLARSRTDYSQLRETYLRSPDGGWINDGEGGSGGGEGGTIDVDAKERERGKDVQVNNPLSLDKANPWQEWFEDLELRRTIRQDVQRTFPEIDYFRLPATQDSLTNLLFIYCKLNPDIGYRQGMHELLAPLFWVIDYDSLTPLPNSIDSLPHLVLSQTYIENDTWSLFSALMKSAKSFYDFTPSVAITPTPPQQEKSSPNSNNGSTTNLTLSHSMTSHSSHPTTSTVLVQPIVATAIRIHDRLLRIIDNALYTHLETLSIEPQLFSIRWLRLLFSREFPISQVLLLWDGLFSEDSQSLRLTEFISIAMLERIRDSLLQCDYSSSLQLLLRFPETRDGEWRIGLIVQQAIKLRDNISSETGVEIRGENEEAGAVSGEGFGDRRDSYDEMMAAGAGAGAGAGPRRQGMGMGGRQHGRNQSVGLGVGAALFAEGGGIVGDLAKGVYGRAEALGINKAFFGTFNDLRKSVNGQITPPPGFSTIPSRPPWEDNSRLAPPSSATTTAIALNAQRELTKLRSSNVEISKAITLCLDVLEAAHVKNASVSISPEEEETKEQEEKEDGPSAGDGFMALTALKHIRDVLAGSERAFDPNVLSPLLHSIDVFPSPTSLPPSPELPTAPSPQPPLPPSHSPTLPPLAPSPTLAPLRPAVVSAPISRSLSNESTGSARSSSQGTPPPLLPGGPSGVATLKPTRGEPPPRAGLTRTPYGNVSSSSSLPPSSAASSSSALGYEKNLPARPIPPWESQKMGSTAATRRPSAGTAAAMPRLPPSASTTGRSYPPVPSSQQQQQLPPSFPPTSFSVRPSGGGARSAKSNGVVDDPLGAAG